MKNLSKKILSLIIICLFCIPGIIISIDDMHGFDPAWTFWLSVGFFLFIIGVGIYWYNTH